jgi:hypothetical protein
MPLKTTCVSITQQMSPLVHFFYLHGPFFEPDPTMVGASDIGQDLEYLLRVHTTYLFLKVPPGTSRSTWNLCILNILRN